MLINPIIDTMIGFVKTSKKNDFMIFVSQKESFIIPKVISFFTKLKFFKRNNPRMAAKRNTTDKQELHAQILCFNTQRMSN